MKNRFDAPTYNLKIFDLLSALFSIVNDERTANETNRMIADYLLRNLNNLEQLTIYDVAEECYVSRSSIHRFLKLIGIDQFSRLGTFVSDSKLHYQAYLDYANRDNFANYVKSSMNSMMDDIIQISDSDAVLELVRMIHNYDRVCLLIAETSSSPARHFQEELVTIGKFIYVYTDATLTEDSLVKLTEKDLLITCSVTGNYAFAVTNDLDKISATKILITINHSDEFIKHYDKIIYMGKQVYIRNHIYNGNRNVYTKYGLLFFFDIIYHHYIKLYVKTKDS